MIKESVWTIGDVNPKCPFKQVAIIIKLLPSAFYLKLHAQNC